MKIGFLYGTFFYSGNTDILLTSAYKIVHRLNQAIGIHCIHPIANLHVCGGEMI